MTKRTPKKPIYSGLSALDHLVLVTRKPRSLPGSKAWADFTEAAALPAVFKMPRQVPASRVYYVLRHGSQFVRTYKIQHDKRTMTYTPKLKLACEFQFKNRAMVASTMLPGVHGTCEVVDFGGDIGLVVFDPTYGPFEDGTVRLS